MKITKKAGVCLLAFLMVLSLFLGGNPGAITLKGYDISAKEGSTITSMSEIKNTFPINKLDRGKGEGLWKITAGGKTAFCLNSGKSMCSGDTVKYKTHNAVTFKEQAIAKALTYYYKKSSKSDKTFALIQAYIWAYGKGVSKIETVYQAAKNFENNYSSADAKKFCDKISETDPQGTIYYYSVTHCVKGKKHDKHQMLYRLAVDEVKKPERDSLNISDKKSCPEELNIKIQKKDRKTAAGLSGAIFRFYCDGESVGTATTGNDGIATFLYTRNLETKTQSIKKKYITNWNELTKSQKEEETKNGYYSSKAQAQAVAQKELHDKLMQLVKDLKSKSHTWKAQEINAPKRHKLNQRTIKKIESGTMTTIEFGDVFDEDDPVKIEINKKSIRTDFGTDASYIDAEYGVYAKTDILKSDNKTVLYQKDTKVTTIVTDINGYGCANGLFMGEYYLKEEKEPNGFQRNDATIDVVLDQNKKIDVYDEPYTGKLRIHKTYDDDHKNEEKAAFEIYNSKEQLVDTIITGNDGMATTKELPYGSYRIHQIKGMAGFSKISDLIKVIDGSVNTYEIELNNPREDARISITKTISINDKQTALYKKRPEIGAKFQIIRKLDQQIVQTLITDENGYAVSKVLDSGTYTVHQIAGIDNYAFVADFDVAVKAGEHKEYQYILDDPWDGKKLMIKKTMEKNQKEEAEAAAEFIVLDVTKAKDYKQANLSSKQEREEYINSLPKDAVVGLLTTDVNGTASIVLENLKKDHGFLVIQTKGAQGYALAPIYDSRDHTAKEENKMKIYEFTAKDIYSDVASIRIEKQKKISETKTQPESGAVFELIDLDGNVISTLKTGVDGSAMAGKIALGTYILHQTKGSAKHEFIEDQTIILSKKDKDQIVRYSYVDTEKPIDFILSKRSKETKKLLNGATYGIYDDKGKEVAILDTGSMKEGYATCKLLYGHYTIKELKALDGYNKNEISKEFTLDLTSVDYDKEGNGTYGYDDVDEPVYGEISLKKTGDVLTGYDEGFTYENDQISGAVYGLYAREDIKKDDGSVVWKADTLIDKKTTVKDKAVKFTRENIDGVQTTKFYQGAYYVKEISGPYGYCIDQQEHDVVISWDTKPKDVNDIGQTEDVTDIQKPHGNNSPYPSNGIYVLQTGMKINEVIKDAQTITFTWKEAADNVKVVDVSQNEDESIVAWNEGSDYYISSQKAGQVIYMNAISKRMFADCKKLTNIYFRNIDTSGVADMSEMFYGCSKIKELDLSHFNMSGVENVKKMFYGCEMLKTTYVQDQIVKAEDDYENEKMILIRAQPKSDFMIGDTYHAKDFVFSADYDDDGMNELTGITDEDISFEPEAADYEGERKVRIQFKDSGKYKGYDSIETVVRVIDPEKLNVPLETAKQVNIDLQYNDLLQKYNIHLIKKDKQGKLLKGATFALKAACDIVDHKENIIFKKGDIISKAISEDDQFGYVEFFGLPTDLYAKDKNISNMYIVEEVSPPDGYTKTEEKLLFHGKVLNDKTENIIHDTVEEKNINDNESTYLHDSKVIENEKSSYITLKKYWIDDDNAAKKRPETLTITARHIKTQEVKTYILNEANNWQIQTDIRKDEKNLYEFQEQLKSSDYKSIGNLGGTWNEDTYVVSYVNKFDCKQYVNLNAQKIWNDAENADGIRPDHVKIKLYANGIDMGQDKILDESNHWKVSYSGLPKTDDVGNTIKYEIRECETDTINGNHKSGYEIVYDVSETIDSLGNTNINTEITNTHTPKTTQKLIQKLWEDQNDLDKIRPDCVKFHLMANGKVVDTVVLSESNGWKAHSKILPKYHDGKEIVYTWEEEKEGVITGEPQIGYAVSYEEDDSDKDKTIAINEHTPGKGSITIYKEFDKPDLSLHMGDAIFTFTLIGKDVYGRQHKYRKDIIFKKDEVEKMIDLHKKQKIRLSETFEDLPYGIYTCSESGMEQYFGLKSLMTASSNGDVSADGKTVTFKIGPQQTEGIAKLTGEATFINQMREGQILLKKKDGKGKALDGVEFTIEDSDGRKIATKITDVKGEVKFENLLPDTYVITETKTKQGHSLLKEPIRVSLPMILTQTEVEQNKADVTKAIQKESKYYFYQLAYEVNNDFVMKLPTTGESNKTKMCIFLISGMILILGGILVFYKKRKK